MEARASFCNLEPVLVQLIQVTLDHRRVQFERDIHVQTNLGAIIPSVDIVVSRR